MVSAVIGSRGFLGSALRRYTNKFLEEEWVGITRDNYTRWSGTTFKNVIWCGGMSSKIKCNENPDECWKQNVDNLRDALYDFPCEKFIYISSYDVYASTYEKAVETDVQPLSDDYVSKLSWYGKSKLCGEEVVKIWSEMGGGKFLVARANGFVGPNLSKNVVYDLTREDPKLYVSWDSKFQYIHVDKFAEILIALIQNIDNETINVTSPDVVSPADVANILGIDFKKVKMPIDKMISHVHAVMNTTKLEQILEKLGIQMPSSREVILNWDKPLY